MPAGSFEHARSRTVVPISAVELASIDGDTARARAAARGLRDQLLQLQPATDYERQSVAEELRRLHLALGLAQLHAGNYAAAQQQYALVGEARKSLPTVALVQRREAADDAALWAVALAHSGRLDEARALAGPALALQRELHARQTDDQWHKFSLALALVASALTTPAQADALLAEAQAALDSMPADARGLRSSRLLQVQIAEARRAGR